MYNTQTNVISSVPDFNIILKIISDYSRGKSLDEIKDNMIVGNGFDSFGLSKINGIAPEAISLSDAYPNPFNPTTTFSFGLPIEAEVSLSIYNLQGREIVSLINANIDAGHHSVIWNADSHSSGVYFVKMIAGEFINTQKLMLIK